MLRMSGDVYECEIQVRLRDLNVGGHVDNVEVARVISEARVLFLRYADLGHGPTGLFGALPQGVHELVASQTVEYRAEMYFAPHEPYLVRQWIGRVGSSSFALSTELRTDPNAAPAAVAETVQALRTEDGPWKFTDAARAHFERFLDQPVALRSRS